ncbi:uncharacterized protein LOC110241373 [Exaiptasia diaphana]|uniref:Tyrosinase copper-binding domain-containing protein n=1 Tax=Exaiptasia diaphana TaxID=2652724 RepID=A0A913XDR8_EXADI|nr:uncharacterized protein LOC110241373 [Exaiptasia diaphana]
MRAVIVRKESIILIILMGLAYTESTRCPKNGVAYNRCGDRCLCTHGRLTQCARIRRDFISMNWGERLRFVRTFLAATKQEPYKSEYERLVATHTRNFKTGIHKQEQFLPWHRWYLLQMENLFRKIDCRVTVPYWDWSLFSGTPWRSTLNDLFSSAPWGFGGNGHGGEYCVTSGPFNRYQWQTTASNHRQCLKRRFNGNPPDIVAVAEIMKYNDRQFNDFEIAVRDTLHDNMHCRIGGRGGTMCSLSSANAPEFLLHHGFTDKLWSDWQKKGWNYKNAYFKRVFSRMTDTGLRPDAVLDLNHQPGGVRVIYQDPTHSKYQEVHRYLQQLTLQELKDIPRHR